MKILIACEFSGIVRDAFLEKGHDAWSCDLLPTESTPSNHIVGDVTKHLDKNWDLMIAHPPCTRLCNSGVRWLHTPPPGKTAEQIQSELEEGAELFSTLLNAPISKICIENPVMHCYAKELIQNFFPHTQSVQPWMFGHGECKRTCFWLKNLPLLTPTNIVEGREQRVASASPSSLRWKVRSRFYEGIAKAMADQWG